MNQTRRTFLGTIAAVASMPFAGFKHTGGKNDRMVFRSEIRDRCVYWQKIDWTEVDIGDFVLLVEPDGKYVGEFMALSQPFVNSDGQNACVFEPIAH